MRRQGAELMGSDIRPAHRPTGGEAHVIASRDTFEFGALKVLSWLLLEDEDNNKEYRQKSSKENYITNKELGLRIT